MGPGRKPRRPVFSQRGSTVSNDQELAQPEPKTCHPHQTGKNKTTNRHDTKRTCRKLSKQLFHNRWLLSYFNLTIYNLYIYKKGSAETDIKTSNIINYSITTALERRGGGLNRFYVPIVNINSIPSYPLCHPISILH